MKGLLKNNFLAVWVNAKVFLFFMLAFGIFVVAVPSQNLQMYFVIIGIVGFSVNASASIGNEYTSKWGKYKLTLPVMRADIIKSLFFNQLIWLLIGLLLIGTGIVLSYLLHGFTSDQFIGILSLSALGISISLFMGAMFIPLLYLGGEERNIVFLIITLLCAIGIASLIFNITIASPLLGTIVLLLCSLLLFVLSYPLTLCIFKRKEY